MAGRTAESTNTLPVVAPSLLTAAPAACSSNPFSLGMEDWDDSPESTPLKRMRYVQQPTDSEGAGPLSLPPSKKKQLSLSKPKQRWEFLDECAQGALTNKFYPKNTNASTKWAMSNFSGWRKSWNTCVVANSCSAFAESWYVYSSFADSW